MSWGTYVILKERPIEGFEKKAFVVYCSGMSDVSVRHLISETPNVIEKFLNIFEEYEDEILQIPIKEVFGSVTLGEFLRFFMKLYEIYNDIVTFFEMPKILIDVLKLKGYEDFEIVSESDITSKAEELEKEGWIVVEI